MGQAGNHGSWKYEVLQQTCRDEWKRSVQAYVTPSHEEIGEDEGDSDPSEFFADKGPTGRTGTQNWHPAAKKQRGEKQITSLKSIFLMERRDGLGSNQPCDSIDWSIS